MVSGIYKVPLSQCRYFLNLLLGLVYQYIPGPKLNEGESGGIENPSPPLVVGIFSLSACTAALALMLAIVE